MHKTQIQITALFLSAACIWFMPNERPKPLVTLKCSRLLAHLSKGLLSIPMKMKLISQYQVSVHLGMDVFQPAIIINIQNFIQK